MRIELTDSEDPKIREAISAHLWAHNIAAIDIPLVQHTLAVVLRDASGAIEGGMLGRTGFRWFSLDLAYVPEHRRGGGLGRSMLAALEQAAIGLGCTGVRTASYSYQAPSFYQRCGYTAYATLEGHPIGQSNVALMKRSGLGDGDTGLPVEQDPGQEVKAAIRALLLTHDEGHTAPPAFRELSVLLRDEDDNILGGLAGYTGYGWLSVDQFALPPALRGVGHGRQLMTMALDEARARGAVGARLATASYQARPFYEKLGFAVCGTIENYLPGHERYLMAQRFN